MYNFGSFDAFIVKPTIMPDFARNLLHYCKKPALLVPNADDTVVGACDEIEPWNQVVPVADYIIYHSC